MNVAKGSERRYTSHPVTIEEEHAAEHFLQLLRDAATSDDVAVVVTQAFTSSFRAFHEGRITEAATKTQVTNLLIDEEPTMIDEFLQLFESCCHTRSWAGLPPPQHLSNSGDDVQLAEEGSMSHGPLAPSLSGIASISYAPTREVGTVGGAKIRRKGSRSSSQKKGPQGKLEWQALAKRLVPEGRASYALWFTVANIGIILAVFAYMAGDYATWVREHRQEFSTDSTIPSRSDQAAQELLLSAGRVPQYLQKWLDWRATWQTFSFEFLKYWGGRWAPALERGGEGGRGAWWLWLTSIYIHQNLNHIISNLLLFVAMSVHLELNYGWWRLLAVWLTSGIGANLVSAAFEPNCTLLVGASGAVFGFMGLFVADLVVNFESISWPFLRVFCIVLFVVFFIVNALSDDSSPRVSHASHIGGLVCGLFPSLLFLPNIRNKRIRALKRQLGTGEGPAAGATANTRNELEQDLNKSLRQSFWTRSFPINPLYIIGALVVAAIYIMLPVYIYTQKLSGVCCDPDKGTTLACSAEDAAAGAGDDITPNLRRLLTPSVSTVSDPLHPVLVASDIDPWPGGGSRPAEPGADPWGHYIARG